MRPVGSVRWAPAAGLPFAGGGGGSSTYRVVPFREGLLPWTTVMSLLSLMTGSFAHRPGAVPKIGWRRGCGQLSERKPRSTVTGAADICGPRCASAGVHTIHPQFDSE